MRSSAVFCTTWRWSRWRRPPRLWWRRWATLRRRSSAPNTWSTSGRCSRLDVPWSRVAGPDPWWFLGAWPSAVVELFTCVHNCSWRGLRCWRRSAWDFRTVTIQRWPRCVWRASDVPSGSPASSACRSEGVLVLCSWSHNEALTCLLSAAGARCLCPGLGPVYSADRQLQHHRDEAEEHWHHQDADHCGSHWRELPGQLLARGEPITFLFPINILLIWALSQIHKFKSTIHKSQFYLIY